MIFLILFCSNLISQVVSKKKKQMKLLTHNMLESHVNKCNGYPLSLTATTMTTTAVDFNPRFIEKLKSKLDLNVLQKTAESIGLEIDLNDPQSLHHCLLEVEVLEGFMVCPVTQHQFPITNGIPNMLLNDNQV
jgi:multifunctional methyltransferase subunit TRM112